MDSISYNTYLYQQRLEEKKSRRQFAKRLGISPFFYGLIEKGYLKPSRKQTERISFALNIDYRRYLEGASSYPTPLPEKERRNITNHAYHFISYPWLKLLLSLFIGIFTAIMISGFKLDSVANSSSRQFYSEKYLDYFDALKNRGSTSLSVLSEFTRPEIVSKEDHLLVSIKGSYKDESPSHVDYTATYHFDDYRLSFKYAQGDTILRSTLYFYNSGESYMAVYGKETTGADGKATYPIVSLYSQNKKLASDTEEYEAVKKTYETPDILNGLAILNDQFNTLIYEKLGMTISLTEDIFPELENGGRRQQVFGVMALSMKVGGLILAAASLFALAFCILYGEKTPGLSLAQRERKTSKREEAIRPKYKPLKTDWKFPVLVPETVLEIIGIFMVFAGSLRILYYFVVFMGSAYVSGNEFTEIPLNFFRILLIGMFLLYYIDFDSFMNDKRILRCIITYAIIFFALYEIELIGFQWVENAQYIVLNIAIPKAARAIPNNFGTITCYFLLMYFLFHRPTFLKTQKQKVIFRCFSLLPIGIIIFTTLVTLFQQDWGWNLDRPLLFLFKSEKPQFSLLCVSYLVTLYFLKLYYHRKLGQENAERYFSGNKFIWQKNIMVCLIVLFISLCEFALSGNATANSYGFGLYGGLIFLIPILLFYHPHQGERNLAVDWTTLGLYGFSFAIGYVLIGLIVFDAILNEGFSVENIMRYLGSAMSA